MRAIDTVAWTETLGVGRKELPWALKAKARQVAECVDLLARNEHSNSTPSGRRECFVDNGVNDHGETKNAP